MKNVGLFCAGLAVMFIVFSIAKFDFSDNTQKIEVLEADIEYYQNDIRIRQQVIDSLMSVDSAKTTIINKIIANEENIPAYVDDCSIQQLDSIVSASLSRYKRR